MKIEKLHPASQTKDTMSAILPLTQLSEFNLPDNKAIEKVIRSMPSKTCSLDPIPTHVVKNHLNLLLPAIQSIIISSLSSGTFPSQLKISQVKPMPGKSLQLAPAPSKCSPRLVWGYSSETGGPPKTFCPNNNMSGILKMVLMSTQPPRHFSKKIHRIFSSINHRQPVNTQPTHPPCLCLAGWLTAHKPAGHDCSRHSCMENKHFQ